MPRGKTRNEATYSIWERLSFDARHYAGLQNNAVCVWEKPRFLGHYDWSARHNSTDSVSMKRMKFAEVDKKAWLAACCLGDSEAVFQHLKPHNCTIGDGENDREVRRDDLAVSLEFRRERTKYHGSVVAG